MATVLITQCLQRDFVDPIGPHDPLPNLLHVGHSEAERLLGTEPAAGPLAQLIQWAHGLPADANDLVHIRDWHDPDDPAQREAPRALRRRHRPASRRVDRARAPRHRPRCSRRLRSPRLPQRPPEDAEDRSEHARRAAPVDRARGPRAAAGESSLAARVFPHRTAATSTCTTSAIVTGGLLKSQPESLLGDGSTISGTPSRPSPSVLASPRSNSRATWERASE